MIVSDLMTSPARSCSADDHCARAAQLMWDHDCGCVPVTDAQGVLTGIVTDRDLCMATYTSGLPLAAIPVARVMASYVTAVAAETGIEDALAKMAAIQVHRLPVVDANGQLLGVIALSDVLRHQAEQLGEQAAPVLRTLATVSRPRAGEPVVELTQAAKAPTSESAASQSAASQSAASQSAASQSPKKGAAKTTAAKGLPAKKASASKSTRSRR
jgi:CBS domain-containing protein